MLMAMVAAALYYLSILQVMKVLRFLAELYRDCRKW